MVNTGLTLGATQEIGRGQNVSETISNPTKENDLSKVGQSTEAGPAVVTSFSAAALESSRAVTESTQTAEQNPVDQGQQKSAQFSQDQGQQGRIDVIA